MADEQKKKIGRPSLMDDKEALIARVMDYIENHAECGDLVPSVAGLACELMVTRGTVHKWASEDDEFSDTLAILSQKQERLLVHGGLGNTMNATIVKLMMSNHGYSDKVDNTSSDGSMSPAGNKFDKDKYKAAQSELEGKLK